MTTPDRFPGRREEEEVQFLEQASDPTEDGVMVYVNGVGFRFREEGSTKGLSGSGITEEQHRTLRQLIHFTMEGPAEGFSSGAYREQLPSGDIFPTTITWWESSSKLKRIVETAITWTGVNVTTLVMDVYDTDGTTKKATISDAISYSGIVETTRTRTITIY